MATRHRWAWLFRPESMVAIAVLAALLLALGIVMRSRADNASNDTVRIVGASATAAARTASSTAAARPITTATASATATAGATGTASATATETGTPAATASPSGTATNPPRASTPAAIAGQPTVAPAASAAATTGIITLRPAAVGVGETLFVRVRSAGAASGSLTFRGESLPLSLQRDQLWAVVGIPVEAPTGPATLTVTTRDAAGNVLETAEAGYQVVPVDRPIQNLTLTPGEASVLTPEAGQRELELRQQQFSRFDRGRRWSGTFMRPLAGPITTYFAEGRRINGGPPGSFHSGTDIANALGTPVVAAAGARVAWAGEMPIRGNTVILDHGAGVLSHYSHLSEIDVTVNQVVRRGQVLGLVGTTGLSTGPHLHWEVSIYGVNVDPWEWVSTDFSPDAAP